VPPDWDPCEEILTVSLSVVPPARGIVNGLVPRAPRKLARQSLALPDLPAKTREESSGPPGAAKVTFWDPPSAPFSKCVAGTSPQVRRRLDLFLSAASGFS